MSRKSTPDIMGAVLTATPETWDGKEIDYPLARIKVGQRMRPLAPAEIEAMAESLRQIGLLNAIHLLPDGTLVAGNHRRAAAELLGWTHIRARIVELNDIDAELAEIDENLRRSNLSILEEAEHLLRREELLEAKGSRAKPGDNQHTAGDGGGATVAPPPVRLLDASQIFFHWTLLPRTLSLSHPISWLLRCPGVGQRVRVRCRPLAHSGRPVTRLP